MDVGGTKLALDLAPSLRLPPCRLNQVRRHAVLAHGVAVQAIRARRKKGTKIGPAENIITAVPLIESQEHLKAEQIEFLLSRSAPSRRRP